MISAFYLHSKSGQRPLRIGVLVDTFFLPAAFRQIVRDIVASDYARIEVVVTNQCARNSNQEKNKLIRYFNLCRKLAFSEHPLYAIYEKFDRRFAQKPNPLDLVDCMDILGGLPRVDVIPIAKRYVHFFPPEPLAILRSYELDVFLRFGFNILRGDILNTARYGVWSFHHGDNRFYRGGPAMFWEIVEENTCSGVILQRLTEELDNGQVLCKAIFPTKPGLSRQGNAFAPFWGSTHFVIRKLYELHERGWDYVDRGSLPSDRYQGKTAIYRTPTNKQLVSWFVPKLSAKIGRRLNPFRKPTLYHWRVCLRRAESPRLLGTTPNTEHKWVSAPPGHMYADPFLFLNDGQMWLFFEDYSYSQRCGIICCGPIQSDLSVGPIIKCLDRPYHLSYPFVFRHNGEIFMIPESVGNGDVELWRATDFPFRWTLEKVLFKGSLMDTTPFFHNSRWYFFTTIAEPPGNGVFSALFCADQLTSDWVLHPRSPLCTDVRYARPAGPLQELDGRCLRPVQDCAERYGRRIHVKEVFDLTPETYSEKLVGTLEPDWEEGLLGTHTYGYCCGVEVLDGLRFTDRNNVMRNTT